MLETPPTNSVTTVADSNLNIIISSKPPLRYQLTPTMIDDMVCKPDFMASFMLGLRLDAFQTARLKIFWFTPRVMDSSGFSSAKSIGLWIVSVVGCPLMED